MTTIVATDQGPVVLGALLRGELVRLRRGRELTQEHVASQLEWSPSKLIRIEGGRSSITKVDLDALLDTYGVTSRGERDHMQALNRGAREHAWWDPFRGELNATYLDYVGYEAGAAYIRQFQNSTVPGLLQTGPYARAQHSATSENPLLIDTAIRMRLRRQSEMAKRMPPARMNFILDEAVIRRHVGVRTDPGIMPDQLRQIVARIRDDDRLTVRIVPFSAGAHAGMNGPFTLLEFEGPLLDLLYLDTGKGVISLSASDDRTLAGYADAFESLADAAMSPDDSAELMLSAAAEMS